MSHAVETSEVILVFFSKAYKNSTNCRTEAEYAYQLRKVKHEPQCTPQQLMRCTRTVERV